MGKCFFACLYLFSPGGASYAGIQSAETLPILRGSQFLNARSAPTYNVKWPAQPVPSICIGSSRMHLRHAICAASNREERRQFVYFFVPKDIKTPDRRKVFLQRWEETAKNFKAATF